MAETNYAGFGEVMDGSAGADQVSGCGFNGGTVRSRFRCRVYKVSRSNLL